MWIVVHLFWTMLISISSLCFHLFYTYKKAIKLILKFCGFLYVQYSIRKWQLHKLLANHHFVVVAIIPSYLNTYLQPSSPLFISNAIVLWNFNKISHTPSTPSYSRVELHSVHRTVSCPAVPHKSPSDFNFYLPLPTPHQLTYTALNCIALWVTSSGGDEV